jgi:hypothetical protein
MDALPMLARCMKLQNQKAWIEFAVAAAPSTRTHRREECGSLSLAFRNDAEYAPNLILWTGSEHRLVLCVKADDLPEVCQ